MKFYISAIQIFLFFSCQTIYAQLSPEDSGLIPLQTHTQAASDLIWKEQKLSPEQALQYFKAGEIKDLSLLLPQEGLAWREQGFPIPQNEYANLNLKALGETLQFSNLQSNRSYNFLFVAKKVDEQGRSRYYNVLIGPRAQNSLLKKALLRKLGYRIPDLVHLQNFRIQFDGPISRRTFVDKLKNLFINSENCLKDAETTGLDYVDVQDAVVWESQNQYFQLATSFAKKDIEGRRVFNALLIPYNLVDVPDSINLMAWRPGIIYNKSLILPLDTRNEFYTNYDDARFITRKILKFQRADWQDIVKQANFPKAAELILVEKLIARRNYLRETFELSNESEKLDINESISYSDELIDGKMQVKSYPMYCKQFAADEPDTPLVNKEIRALLNSKLISNALIYLVTKFNNGLPKSNLGKNLFDHTLDLLAWQFAQFLITKKPVEIPKDWYSTNVYGINLIINRDTIAGSYLGTDNLVQQADTIGVSGHIGKFAQLDGQPSDRSLNANLNVHYTLTYTHVTPISKISEANRTSFRNLAIPWLMNKYASYFDDIYKEDFESLSNQEKYKKLQNILKEFDDNFKVGESLIITEARGAELNLSPNMSFGDRMKASLSIFAGKTKLKRIHIFKKDKDTIQVFRDPASKTNWGFDFGIDNYLKLFEYRNENTKGRAETKLSSVNLSLDPRRNENIVPQLKALSEVLSEGDTKPIMQLKKPYVLTHKFKEDIKSLGFLFFNKMGVSSQHHLEVKTPNEHTKTFSKFSTGKREGFSIEDIAVKLINLYIDENSSNSDLNIYSNNNGDPGLSYKGRSLLRQVNAEMQIAESQHSSIAPAVYVHERKDPFVNIQYRWNSFKIKKDDLVEINNEINKKFNFTGFHPSDLNNISECHFCSVYVNFNIYQDGLNYLSQLSLKQVLAILDEYANYPQMIQFPYDKIHINRARSDAEARQQKRDEQWRRIFLGRYKRFVSAYNDPMRTDSSKELAQFLDVLELIIDGKGIEKLFDNQFYINTSIQGYRKGDENVSPVIFGNSKNQISDQEKPDGPMRFISQNLGIGDSEFFIYWLMTRL